MRTARASVAVFVALSLVLIARATAASSSAAQQEDSPRVIVAIVALADNENQGIVPVPAQLGNGDDPAGNLYWGARYGLKAFFSRSADWKLVGRPAPPDPAILERCVFKHKTKNVYLVADAFAGRAIKDAIIRFLRIVSGADPGTVSLPVGDKTLTLPSGSDADLAAYIGHDGLMDFSLDELYIGRDTRCREAIVFACYSQSFFAAPLRNARACPLLWTTGLMAPEAYTLKAALDGWILDETAEQVRMRAAQAYADYQKISLKSAKRLFISGR